MGESINNADSQRVRLQANFTAISQAHKHTVPEHKRRL